MLCDRLDLIMREINAENADIAEIAGFDRSNVSRMRSGARVPLKNGSCMARTAGAVITCAAASGKTDALCRTIAFTGEPSPEELRRALTDWLYEDSALPSPKEPSSDPEAGLYFSKKLTTLIQTAGISGVKLSKAVNIDPSYLSRMRTGKHLPNERSKVLERICAVLIQRTADRKELSMLSEAVNIPEELLAAQPRLLMEWLLSTHKTAYKLPVEQLMGRIGTMDRCREAPIPPPDPARIAEAEADTSELYSGLSGLRRAVVRFLSTSFRAGSELLLYSDQSMDWMSGPFRSLWLSLMAQVLKKGVKIKIIHNIQRTSSEMLEAITSWLPLYMTGSIEPFYCLRRHGERFGHTLFLDPENACISGFCAFGSEEMCDYSYITDPKKLDQWKQQFELLLDDCRPLLRISDQVPEPPEGSVQRTVGSVRLVTTEKEAVLSKLSEPTYSFSFDHPLLMRAFRHFAL
ncbi:MAG: helix-turn-helix transcriptional regulator [Ruminococcus sp.]|nr:helix-turn-helix transcriptional regulator [Ruminococcus sp.]